MKKIINVIYCFLFIAFLSLVGCQDTAKQKNTSDKKNQNTAVDSNTIATNIIAEPVQNLPEQFYKRLEGDVSGEKMVIHLIRTDTFLRGTFFSKQEKHAFFNTESTINKQGIVKITAYNENDDSQIGMAGMFDGKFLNTATLKGSWQATESAVKSNFLLTEKYEKGSVQLDVIHFEKQLDCDEDKACATMKLHFPKVRKAGNKKLANAINATINKNLLEMLNELATNPDEADANSIETATAAFFDSFGEDGEPYGQMWSNEIDWDIYYNRHSILSFGLNKYYYTGGAHPNYMSLHFNFDLNKGEKIKLDDLFEGDYETLLLKLAEKELRLQQDIPANAPLSDFIFETELTLNENFYISSEGITFVYDPYEIAPYAVGTITLPIAFKDIKKIIKKDGLLGK